MSAESNPRPAVPRGLFGTVVAPVRAERAFPKPVTGPVVEGRHARLRGTLAYVGEPVVRTPVVVGDEPEIPIELAAPEDRGTLEAPRHEASAGLTRPTVLPPEGASAYEPFGARERFARVRTLGRGAMGEVELVSDVDLGRTVAIKHMLDGAPADRFVGEIRTLGRLEHPNIVPLHDVGVDAEGRYFFVMKHVEGETLAEIIERLRAREPAYVALYTFERRIEIVLGILHALEHAHESGILHRDLKPENVMIGKHGEVQLMDWGIALPFRAGARPSTDEPRGAVTGTPWFMSPEQARGETDTLDARSDLYAVGALFHELLLLRHYLGDERDPVRVVERVGQEGWTQSLLDWHRGPGPMPPMELYHFVRRAMAFERARRWSSAGEMIAELHRILDGRVRVQCPITLVKSTTRHAGRFVDRWPWLSFFAYAGTAALAAWGALQLLGAVP
ncbi:MAG: hypothetical protein OHK0013_09990 [Sandaracinaceae bacterium]